MIDPEERPSALPDGIALCDVCGGALPPIRYVHVEGSAMDVLCSAKCHRTIVRAWRRVRWAARQHFVMRTAVTAIFLGALLAPHEGPPGRRRVARAATVAPRSEPSLPALPPGWYGPDWPPTEPSLLAALGQDTWIHPLSGPVRRMPRADSRVFGAARPGTRPIECRNGHCGVDLGGEIWGEHIHAVHDGVVDFVQRNANPDRGGEFVRLSHRDGTVFTQYFHLAAIPRGLERGAHVKSGDVIGLLGDTGVKESAPHLHFAISVRPWKDGPERYIDPEPLIALWAVRVPVEGSEVGLVTTAARPGMPLGSAALSGKRRKDARLAKLRPGSRPDGESASGEGDGANETTPAREGGEEPAAPSDDAPAGAAPSEDE
jgi:murein DD-endopeptidase MepM/ murein hydrolase activator NlpD